MAVCWATSLVINPLRSSVSYFSRILEAELVSSLIICRLPSMMFSLNLGMMMKKMARKNNKIVRKVGRIIFAKNLLFGISSPFRMTGSLKGSSTESSSVICCNDNSLRKTFDVIAASTQASCNPVIIRLVIPPWKHIKYNSSRAGYLNPFPSSAGILQRSLPSFMVQILRLPAKGFSMFKRLNSPSISGMSKSMLWATRYSQFSRSFIKSLHTCAGFSPFCRMEESSMPWIRVEPAGMGNSCRI